MPRVYDYSHNSELSDRDYVYSVYRERRDGSGEVSYASLWGPKGLFVFDGIHHQFALRPTNGKTPYDNDLVDPVFDWLCENAKGGWHWHEGHTNNYRSIATSVYIANHDDIDAFLTKWQAIFKYDENDTISNDERKAKTKEAEENNVLPSYLTASRMKFILTGMDAEAGEYLHTLSGRDNFAATFSLAFDAAVAYMLEADKPSEYGPRMPDGNWHEAVVGVFKEIGTWIRERAPDELREEIIARDIPDEGLEQAFRSGLADPTPTPVGASPAP
jgi:hypothetical protein